MTLPLTQALSEATEGSRALDARIALMTHWKPMGNISHWVNDWEKGFEAAETPGSIRMVNAGVPTTWAVPTYTTDLNAIVALIEERDWYWLAKRLPPLRREAIGKSYWATAGVPGEQESAYANGKALALCLALVSAIEAEGK